jgi:hypothetical protein
LRPDLLAPPCGAEVDGFPGGELVVIGLFVVTEHFPCVRIDAAWCRARMIMSPRPGRFTEIAAVVEGDVELPRLQLAVADELVGHVDRRGEQRRRAEIGVHRGARAVLLVFAGSGVVHVVAVAALFDESGGK